jgi:hypothetical protein
METMDAGMQRDFTYGHPCKAKSPNWRSFESLSNSKRSSYKREWAKLKSDFLRRNSTMLEYGLIANDDMLERHRFQFAAASNPPQTQCSRSSHRKLKPWLEARLMRKQQELRVPSDFQQETLSSEILDREAPSATKRSQQFDRLKLSSRITSGGRDEMGQWLSLTTGPGPFDIDLHHRPGRPSFSSVTYCYRRIVSRIWHVIGQLSIS